LIASRVVSQGGTGTGGQRVGTQLGVVTEHRLDLGPNIWITFGQCIEQRRTLDGRSLEDLGKDIENLGRGRGGRSGLGRSGGHGGVNQYTRWGENREA
jgi:hypothetical protein